ncbi:MAG TPA: glycosyltransferase family 2 protein [Acidobacteriaceae bacterium]|nr:glycosyltransferase family 2 protein [Acidobacteriaceae bacterium]
MKIKLAIIIPCYNEEQVLPTTVEQVTGLLGKLADESLIAPDSTVTFIDDGSGDGTWPLIEQASRRIACVAGIKLSRNRGHQNALLAGLLTVDGDAVVSLDADLQDDLGAIRDMLVKHQQGAEIVYGVRDGRKADRLLKKATAEGYYRLLRKLGVDVVFNHADYRLMSRAAIEALRGFGEVNLFLRGIVPQLGFKTDKVYYDRAERRAGESKYPVGKMLALAWEGLTSFSPKPLRWITLFGSIVSLFSFLVGTWALAASLSGRTVPGWASTVIPVYFLGGIQLLSLGIIGEYISKIYLETKRRPRFVIERRV